MIVVTYIDGQRVWANNNNVGAYGSNVGPNGSGASHHREVHNLPSMQVLEALMACVFQSPMVAVSTYEHVPDIKRGICHINLQILMYELSLTKNALSRIHAFIETQYAEACAKADLTCSNRQHV